MTQTPFGDRFGGEVDKDLVRKVVRYRKEAERSTKIHAIMDAMLDGDPVWFWSKLGHWQITRVLEIRRSGTVIVESNRPGLVLSFEPGEIMLDNPSKREG